MARGALLVLAIAIAPLFAQPVSDYYSPSYGYGYGEPVQEVVPEAPEPTGENLVMGDLPGQSSTLPYCLIDHGAGCEQCEDEAFKVGDAAAPECVPCDFDLCAFCNDFKGCGQCDRD